MLQYPDHVGKSLLHKLSELEALDKTALKHFMAIIRTHESRLSILGEIKGMIQAEEYENESKNLDGEDRTIIENTTELPKD